MPIHLMLRKLAHLGRVTWLGFIGLQTRRKAACFSEAADLIVTKFSRFFPKSLPSLDGRHFCEEASAKCDIIVLQPVEKPFKMDVRDVSGSDQIVALLRQIRQQAERAAQRKGQRVRDHPHTQLLISTFMTKRLASNLRPLDGQLVATSQVPQPYQPCYQPAAELQPMAISDMTLETHHRGKKTLLCIRTPPNRMTAVMAIAEDEEGTAVLLQLYFQPEESTVPADAFVRPGATCILKDPFFKCAPDGTYSLRVDHLTDIIWLDDADDRIPLKWRKPALALSDTSTNVRMHGNGAVKKEEWFAAERLYSMAISVATTPEEKQLAYLNRSLSNLKLGRLEKALEDAELGSDDASVPEKGLFRQARALYELRKFSRCLEIFEELTKSYPDNADAAKEMKRVKERLHEEQTGQYAFRNMYKQAMQTPPLIDCATFSAPVEVRPSAGRGRGLFATRPVSAGQLLLCEKAFCYSYVGDGSADRMTILMNVATNKASMGAQAHLLTQTMQKLYHSPEALRLFVDLHRGDYVTPEITDCDGHLVVDSFLVEKIRALNSFGAPKTSREYFAETRPKHIDAKKDKAVDHTTNGIWLLASRINHSCVGNCLRSFIGDVQIVRATGDLEAGSELSFGYKPLVSLESYDETQKHLGGWGFTCACDLCASRKATPRPALQRRKTLFRGLQKAVRPPRGISDQDVKQWVGQIEETYSAAGSGKMARTELWDLYFCFADGLLSAGRPADAVGNIVLGLEALGFSITASPPPIGGAAAPRLEVTQWGLAHDCTAWAFLKLHAAYRSLAPELCPVAKKYWETAYSMVVGEAETAFDDFPELE